MLESVYEIYLLLIMFYWRQNTDEIREVINHNLIVQNLKLLTQHFVIITPVFRLLDYTINYLSDAHYLFTHADDGSKALICVCLCNVM